MGEDISELGLEHLEKIEDQIDIGSKAIRARKVIKQIKPAKINFVLKTMIPELAVSVIRNLSSV